jgi:hypothetical protein
MAIECRCAAKGRRFNRHDRERNRDDLKRLDYCVVVTTEVQMHDLVALTEEAMRA